MSFLMRILIGLAVVGITSPCGFLWTRYLVAMGFPFDGIAQRMANLSRLAISDGEIFWGTFALISSALWVAAILVIALLLFILKRRRATTRRARRRSKPTANQKMRLVGGTAVAALLLVSLVVVSVWTIFAPKQVEAACRPYISWLPDLPITDPQLNEPAMVKRLVLTRSSHTRYNMKIAGLEAGLRNLNVGWDGFSDEKVTKRQVDPKGIELLLRDPVGLVAIAITPRHMGDTPINIEFECLGDGTR